MKLLILFLIVVVVCVDAQQQPRYCSRLRKCRNTEVCVRTPTSGFWSWLWSWFRLGVCKPRKPQVKTCSSGSDCGQNECCESTAQLRGRKKRQIGGTSGVCKPLQKSGQSCLTQYSSGKPASTVLQCPCTGELTCISDGGRLVPQGETGVCGVPEPEPKPCTSGSDCGWNECCESTTQVKGRKKRQSGGSPGIGGTEGVCKPLQKTTGSCLIQYASGKPPSTVLKCPCEFELQCEADGNNTPPLGYTGICRAPVRCGTGADCGAGECCKSLAKPRGRRRRQAAGGGVCEPLGDVGDSCLTIYSPGKPDAMVYSCPCETGLQCHGSGTYDIPIGEKGTCSE